jgi:hypothetical protein
MAEQITRDEFTDYMEAFEQRFAARFGRADRRLEGIEGRLDDIEGRFDGFEISQAFALEPPQRTGDRATRERTDEADGDARAVAHLDRLNAQIERCARLVEDLEDRLTSVRSSAFTLPAEFFVTSDTQDDRTAFCNSGIDAQDDPRVADAKERDVTAPEPAAAARKRTITKANGVTAKSAAAEKPVRQSARRDTTVRAPAPPVPPKAAGRQRRSKT